MCEVKEMLLNSNYDLLKENVRLQPYTIENVESVPDIVKNNEFAFVGIHYSLNSICVTMSICLYFMLALLDFQNFHQRIEGILKTVYPSISIQMFKQDK